MIKAQRILLQDPPFLEDVAATVWSRRGIWPAHWLAWPEADAETCAYRLEFTLAAPTTLRLHCSGDGKYHLYCDGVMLGVGPELGDLNFYHFESYDLELEAGAHCLSALVFDFKDVAGLGQMSLRPGWLAAVEGAAPELFNTGSAPWECLPIRAMRWSRSMSVDPCVEFDMAAYPTGVESGRGVGWRPAAAAEAAADGGSRNEFAPERLLRPAQLPPRRYEQQPLLAQLWVFERPVLSEPLPLRTGDDAWFWNAFGINAGQLNLAQALTAEQAAWRGALDGGARVTVPPHTKYQVIGMLSGYHCVYPRLTTVGGVGAKLELRWAESLFESPKWNDDAPKGDRAAVDGKYFIGLGDRFYPAEGEGRFFTPWWRSGRFFELTVETADAAVEIGELALFDTRYPFDSEIALTTSDPCFNRILPLCLRTVQMCVHDTFMDCPYYEQLMYIGDARLEALVLLAATHDRKMNEKMLRMFAASRRPNGFLYSRYPSRVCQVIPTFSPLWIAALHDYACYGVNRVLVRELLGTAKQIVDAFEARINADGLAEFGQGWNFVDWTPDWCGNLGVPPGGEYGVSGVVNWLLVYGLKHLAELCDYCDEPLVAEHYRRRQRQLTERLIARFWRPEAGLFADDLDGRCFSEHSQCLAILSGGLPEEIRCAVAAQLFATPNLSPASIYFTYYYFECCRVLKRMDAFFERMGLWFDCDNLGLATLLERPEPSRSDCHGWSGHPYFHVPATLAGIRPAEFEFRSVRVTPQPGPLRSLHAEMVHPAGLIVADYRLTDRGWYGEITLPDGVTGEAELPDRVVALTSGRNCLEWN